MALKVEFAKMHGLGNDFMVLDLISEALAITPDQVRAWADRRTGVGFDQLLTVDAPTRPDADFRYRIFNADGTEAQQCGNGARCVALFIGQRKLSPKLALRLETIAGPITAQVMDDDTVEVDLGVPSTTAEEVPFIREAALAPGDDMAAGSYSLRCGEHVYQVTPVSMGNPHGVLFVADIQEAPVAEIGPALGTHAFFPQGANIGFCQIVDRGFLRLRVFERGAGETRACGTGACAAVVAGQLRGELDTRVKVSLPGGKVRVSWQGPDTPVKMAGPATLVYEGQLTL